MGWNLQAADMRAAYLTERDVWQATHQFFYHGKTTTTYKYGFMKALLESLPTANVQFTLSFDALFTSFTKIYWNLVVHHALHQSNSAKSRSAVETTIINFAKQHAIPQSWNFDTLPATQQLDIIEQVKKVGKKYVIGATYSDFNGTIYSFNVKDETLTLHEAYYTFFQAHKRLLTNITNYQLALFLEQFNEADKVTRLLSKVEVVTQRQSLVQFAQLLQQSGVQHCFYCNRTLHKSHVDHFIPWSYMQSDHLWNFVLACPTCNTKKNNKIAATHYLEALIERNDSLQQDTRFTVELSNYNERKLTELYTYSQLNGFVGDWQPQYWR